jgi:hypothetical protein
MALDEYVPTAAAVGLDEVEGFLKVRVEGVGLMVLHVDKFEGWFGGIGGEELNVIA